MAVPTSVTPSYTLTVLLASAALASPEKTGCEDEAVNAPTVPDWVTTGAVGALGAVVSRTNVSAEPTVVLPNSSRVVRVTAYVPSVALAGSVKLQAPVIGCVLTDWDTDAPPSQV